MKFQENTNNEKIEQTCQHYWIIEPPGAETSTGVCKYCGKRKEFMNSYQYRSVDVSFKKRIPEDVKEDVKLVTT